MTTMLSTEKTSKSTINEINMTSTSTFSIKTNKNEKSNFLSRKKFKTNFTRPLKSKLDLLKTTFSPSLLILNKTENENKNLTITSNNLFLEGNCDKNMCQNGGTCSAGTEKKETYECFCLKGYAGYNCELSLFKIF